MLRWTLIACLLLTVYLSFSDLKEPDAAFDT